MRYYNEISTWMLFIDLHDCFLCFLVLTLLLCCHLVFNSNYIFQGLEQVKDREVSKLLLLLRLDFTYVG